METLREKQEAVTIKKSVVEEWEQTVKAQKKEHGRLSRELQKLEKEIKWAYLIKQDKKNIIRNRNDLDTSAEFIGHDRQIQKGKSNLNGQI